MLHSPLRIIHIHRKEFVVHFGAMTNYYKLILWVESDGKVDHPPPTNVQRYRKRL